MRSRQQQLPAASRGAAVRGTAERTKGSGAEWTAGSRSTSDSTGEVGELSPSEASGGKRSAGSRTRRKETQARHRARVVLCQRNVDEQRIRAAESSKPVIRGAGCGTPARPDLQGDGREQSPWSSRPGLQALRATSRRQPPRRFGFGTRTLAAQLSVRSVRPASKERWLLQAFRYRTVGGGVHITCPAAGSRALSMRNDRGHDREMLDECRRSSFA